MKDRILHFLAAMDRVDNGEIAPPQGISMGMYLNDLSDIEQVVNIPSDEIETVSLVIYAHGEHDGVAVLQKIDLGLDDISVGHA